MNKFSILIIEDEKNICDFISKTLTSHGYCATPEKKLFPLLPPFVQISFC